MGRKSLDKERHANTAKRQRWAGELVTFFHDNGLKGFNMDEISNYLNISKATIYNHFVSKEEIVQEVMDLMIDKMSSFTDTITDRSIPYHQRYFNAFKSLTHDYRTFSSRWLEDMKNDYPLNWKEYEKFMQSITNDLEEYYRFGMNHGLIHKSSINLVVGLDICFMKHLALEYKDDVHDDFDLLFKEYFQLRFKGLQSERDPVM